MCTNTLLPYSNESVTVEKTLPAAGYRTGTNGNESLELQLAKKEVPSDKGNEKEEVLDKRNVDRLKDHLAFSLFFQKPM